MSIEEEKWILFFWTLPFPWQSRKSILAYFDYFSVKKGSIYSGFIGKLLSEIKVMVIGHKSISQVLSAANKKNLQISVVRQHVTFACTY